MIRVKVCGITNLEDALQAAEAGADALGFIFVEHTPRFVTPAVVGPIVRALPPFVTPVGVFWNHPAGHVKAVAEACGLRALQLHGDEPPDGVEGHALPVIKTLKVAPGAGAAAVRASAAAYLERGAAAVLLDSAARWSEGERREPIAWELARACAAAGRVILSAGLTPDNVARAIAVARPHAVDVNSGVEARPGRKDPEKVRRFVQEARGA
jgi:phosphoribosylanthranilate isomerase